LLQRIEISAVVGSGLQDLEGFISGRSAQTTPQNHQLDRTVGR
jgi:hypothetical protein